MVTEANTGRASSSIGGAFTGQENSDRNKHTEAAACLLSDVQCDSKHGDMRSDWHAQGTKCGDKPST